MTTDQNADELRRRAAELRRLATRLDAIPLAALGQWCGPDTWTSPGADECRRLLSDDAQLVTRAADELREQALCVDRQADVLDAAATVAAAAALAATAVMRPLSPVR